MDELAGLLDLPFWKAARPFDLAPRRVLDDPAVHAGHDARIASADLRWPLHATRVDREWIVLDGLHRLARATRERRATVAVIEVPAAHVEARRP